MKEVSPLKYTQNMQTGEDGRIISKPKPQEDNKHNPS